MVVVSALKDKLLLGCLSDLSLIAKVVVTIKLINSKTIVKHTPTTYNHI